MILLPQLNGSDVRLICLHLRFDSLLDFWECRGSEVECLTKDGGVVGSSLIGVTLWCPWARHINPCFELVQPRKTRPDITEKLLTGT